MQHAPTAHALFDLLSVYKDNPSLSDVKVAVGNKEFDCHRLLLAAASEFFAAAFRSDMKESREGKITLENVDEEVFSTLLTCLYSGKYVLTDENLFDIWGAADMLQISFLILQCEELFSERLSPQNCVQFVSKVRHISAKAKHTALEFTARNFLDLSVQLQKDTDGYTIQVTDTSGAFYSTFHSQLGSRSRLVTIRYMNEAFALQENGCLWRIKLGLHSSTDIQVTQELSLWDGTVSLNGAVLYNNQLVIVGDFPNQTEISETLDVSLDGVFHSVNKVLFSVTNQKDSPGVILASIPKDFIKFPTKA
ncbi:kelch-like protein 40 [Elysia marginata]|uniref:Kelch-like protein 40 n=1 Tax=Elysia marginata TaxID=1093978 RepID=A0AAV4JF37_9GAST|nr:kelch-like protein 40 [Elysia marginata]